MLDTKNTQGTLRKQIRSSLARTASWLSRQILLKDGGLLTTVRGIAAAALLAVAAKSAPAVITSAQESWRLLALPITVVVLTAVVVLIQRRRPSHEAPEQEAPTCTTPPVPRSLEESESLQTLDVLVRIEIRHGERPD